jgi:hypothetical protein
MKKINRRTLGTCLIPTPPLKVQERLLDRILRLRKATGGMNDACRASNALKTALLESITGGQS